MPTLLRTALLLGGGYALQNHRDKKNASNPPPENTPFYPQHGNGQGFYQQNPPPLSPQYPQYPQERNGQGFYPQNSPSPQYQGNQRAYHQDYTAPPPRYDASPGAQQQSSVSGYAQQGRVDGWAGGRSPDQRNGAATNYGSEKSTDNREQQYR